MEFNLIELMGFAVIEKHVFARCRGVAEAVADIEAEAASIVKDHLTAAPIPCIVIGPDSSAPVKRCKRAVLLIEFPSNISEGHCARCSHAVDFLIIIKMLILVKRRGDSHTLLGNICQRNIKAQELARVAVIAVCAIETACFTVVFKSHVTCADGCVNIALLACGGQIHFAHRESSDLTVVHLKRLVAEAQQRNAQAAYIAAVGNCKTKAAVLIADIIVVPLLDSEFGSFNIISAVIPVKLLRKARLCNIAVGVQKLLS